MELICAECKNKWMPSNRINEVICPYCGNIIGELSRDFSSFEDGIAYIRNMFGDDIFEQRRFFFICTEYCLDYYEKEISAFKILYDSGLSKRILNLRGSDEKIIVRSKKQFVYQLRMKNGMNTSWAEYVIDLFCFATGISTEKEFSSNILSKVRKAENGDPEAQYQVGICYKDGKGVERSLDDAIKWLSLSAGQKYTEAMVALYHIYAKENNKNIAKKYLEEAVNYGNVNAINTFSIRNFVRAKGGKVLFIEYDLAIGSVLTPIYRLFFDLAIKEALGRTSSQGNVYLFCDEFKLLPNLQHIDDGVNFGRSLGLKVFAGLQSIEQLFETYGEIKGRNLAAGFSSIFAFKANDVSTRDYIRSLYGSNIILEQYQGMNKTLIEDKREGNTVEDWDLNSLKVGEAVVGLPFEKPFKFYFDNFG